MQKHTPSDHSQEPGSHDPSLPWTTPQLLLERQAWDILVATLDPERFPDITSAHGNPYTIDPVQIEDALSENALQRVEILFEIEDLLQAVIGPNAPQDPLLASLQNTPRTRILAEITQQHTILQQIKQEEQALRRALKAVTQLQPAPKSPELALFPAEEDQECRIPTKDSLSPGEAHHPSLKNTPSP